MMEKQLTEKIKSRGYWSGVIRPERFDPELIPSLQDLERIVQKYQVRHRGWYFPHMSSGEPYRGTDFLGLATTFMHHNEVWRYYQSGQFAFHKGFEEDWVEDAKALMKVDLEPGAGLDILSALYDLTEVFEFSARLAREGLLSTQITIQLKWSGLEGRRLFFWPGSGRHLSQKYQAHVPELSREISISDTELLGNSRGYAMDFFLWLMARFGFDTASSVFESAQEKYFQGSFS